MATAFGQGNTTVQRENTCGNKISHPFIGHEAVLMCLGQWVLRPKCSLRALAGGLLRLRSNPRSASTQLIVSCARVIGHLTVLMNGMEDPMVGIQRKHPSVQPISQTGVNRACRTRQDDAPLLPLDEMHLQQLKRWHRVLSLSVRHWWC
ncbi:hypothetical protein N7494_003152 [Penicillium frequentans]|uniref:Uncharacterized protein n=1 Tax=Penicillium frequentans TaxID=3151616 RepID=A0AAD6CYF9_9EURO|nr:hypothetical protein N7494_003152 [Penicillium glabrum]